MAIGLAAGGGRRFYDMPFVRLKRNGNLPRRDGTESVCLHTVVVNYSGLFVYGSLWPGNIPTQVPTYLFLGTYLETYVQPK